MAKRSSPPPLTEEAVDEQAALPGRRERAKSEKRARLVKAARELFSRKGFAASTTSEIAKRADIGAGTLFLYVRSKEELLVLVFQEDMIRVRDESFASLPAGATLLDELCSVYDALAAFHEQDRALARIYTKELAHVSDPSREGVAAFMEGLFARSDERIEMAKARGEIAADVPTRLLSGNLFAIYFARLRRDLESETALTSPECVGERHAALALQLRGLATSAPSSTAGRPPATRVRRRGARSDA